MDDDERIAVPLLVVQTACVVMLWSLDTLAQVSQKIFTLFLAADLLAFGFMAQVFRATKSGTTVSATAKLAWGLAIVILFVAGMLVS